MIADHRAIMGQQKVQTIVDASRHLQADLLRRSLVALRPERLLVHENEYAQFRLDRKNMYRLLIRRSGPGYDEACRVLPQDRKNRRFRRHITQELRNSWASKLAHVRDIKQLDKVILRLNFPDLKHNRKRWERQRPIWDLFIIRGNDVIKALGGIEPQDTLPPVNGHGSMIWSLRDSYYDGWDPQMLGSRWLLEEHMFYYEINFLKTECVPLIPGLKDWLVIVARFRWKLIGLWDMYGMRRSQYS